MFINMDTLKLFFEEPTREFNVREVARIERIAPATASKKLSQLSKEGVVLERRERNLKLFKSNLESDLYRDMKVFYNIRKIRDSGLMEKLNVKYAKPAVVLFGSAASGMDTETSDFDLLVLSENDKPSDLSAFEKRLGRKVQAFFVKDARELKNKHLINNVLNGIALQGEVKWT